MKLKGIALGTGLFIGGFVVGGMTFVSSDTSDSVKEAPVEVTTYENKETTKEAPKEAEKEAPKEAPKQIEALKIFEDDSVIASYYGVENDIAKIIVENKLDIAIDVRDDTFAINGFSTTAMTDLIVVAPKSKGVLQIDLEEISGMYGTPATISGEISVIEPDNYKDITSIKFNSIAVTQ
jgi:hypothetical protein